MQYKKNVLGIRETREQDEMRAENEKLRADLEYVAMMAEVELEEEDGGDEE
ncbi:MAG: hypothetical protein LUG52_07550 [Clostridia bacterium]|nr:hypothetical protein [Clostridia bacterium]